MLIINWLSTTKRRKTRTVAKPSIGTVILRSLRGLADVFEGCGMKWRSTKILLGKNTVMLTWVLMDAPLHTFKVHKLLYSKQLHIVWLAAVASFHSIWMSNRVCISLSVFITFSLYVPLFPTADTQSHLDVTVIFYAVDRKCMLLQHQN